MSPIGKTPVSNVSPANDVLRADRHPLDPIFKPSSVALVGASERAGSVGRTVLWNLISNPFGGIIYPVNSKRSHVLGFRSYASLQELPEVPDLVILCTPADGVPALLAQCVEMGVPAGIVLSSGFKETGEHGIHLEAEILQTIQGRMRLLGPNCLGVMNPVSGLNATFANTMAKPGNVAFISQSGALCTAVLDWSMTENVGFSSFVSVGSMLDVNWGDLIDYFGDDPRTRSIVIYMETIGDASSFLSAAREVSLTKPIIVIKSGRTAAASRAAASHTGSLTGSDAVMEAAFRRVGVLRVNSIAEIFFMTEALSKQPRPRGNRLCIVTNAGGPGVLATDALLLGGGDLAELSPESMAAFNAFLPPAWSHSNPVDILGDAEPDRYAKSLEIAAKDPNTDGMLVIMTPMGMTNPTQIAEQLKTYAHGLGKPVLASWMGGESASHGEEILNRAGIPSFHYPDTAVQAFNYMWRYTYNLRGLYETPSPNAAAFHPQCVQAAEILSTVRESGRTILTEYESKKLLDTYGIPRIATELAASEEEAAEVAAAIGFPVVVKLNSFTITHKTEVGGVALNLPDAASVRRAFRQIRESVAAKAGAEHFQGVTVQPYAKQEGYELILGSSLDPQFGPVLLFGTGGQLVEVFEDRSLALPPLNTTLARRMMEQTRIYKALSGVRGRTPVDVAALEELMVRFSDLVIQNPAIQEIDINPLLATSDRLIALDARVVVHAGQCGRSGASALGDPSLPGGVCGRMEDEGRRGGDDPPHPSRGRAAGDRVPQETERAHGVSALLPAVEADPAHGARAADAHLLHRLRPRDGSGGRAQEGRRHQRDHCGWAVEQDPWAPRGRNGRAGAGRVSGQGTGRGTVSPAHPGGARPAADQGALQHAGREQGDAEPVPAAELPYQHARH